MSDNEGCGLGIAVMVVLSIVSFGIGIEVGQRQMISQAIEHHAAEYRCDPVTGKTEFVWLTDKAETP